MALKLKNAIIKYQEEFIEEFNKTNILNITNWKALENIKDFLQPFKRVIKEIKGDKATFNKVLFTIDFMVEYYKRAFKKYTTNLKLCDCIRTSWHTFNKYYLKTNGVTAYSTALLLAPY